MTTAESNNIATLDGPSDADTRGYWSDAWIRLRRNRMAIIGLVIIILNLLIAVFAPFISPEGIDDQDRDESHAAPMWVLNLFPMEGFTPRDETYRVRTGDILVETGQYIQAGDIMAENVRSGRDFISLYSNMDGTVIVDDDEILLYYQPLTEVPIPPDAQVEVVTDRIVQEGDVLFRTSNILVTTGQQVAAGDVLADSVGTDSDSVTAAVDGIVFYDGWNIRILPLDIPAFTIPEDAADIVDNETSLQADDILFDNVTAPMAGTAYVVDDMLYIYPNDENIALQTVSLEFDTVTASAAGNVYVSNDTIFIRPANRGYVPLRNEYPLGADHQGRDLWSRIAFGTRVSLLVAFIGPLMSTLVGVPYGLISGYFGGAIDNMMMRFVDLMYAFPTLLLIILLMAFFRSSADATDTGTFIGAMGDLDRQSGGMFFIFLGVGLTSWMGLARLTRGQVLSVREQEYVIAARSIGSTTPKIMWQHILPNILGPIVISETLTIPTYIRFEAFLSFIGLGVNPPTPSWGNMISEGADALRSFPHVAIFPALALFLIMFAFNFLGDGLRDALDPRLRGID